MQSKEAWKCIELAGQKAMRDFIYPDNLSNWRGKEDMQKKKTKLEEIIGIQKEQQHKKPNDENLRKSLLEKRSWVKILADNIEKEPSSLRDELLEGDAPSSLDKSKLRSVKAQKVFRQAEDAMKRHNKEFADKFVLMVGQPNNRDYESHLMGLSQNLPGRDFDVFKTKLEEYRKNTDGENWISPKAVLSNSRMLINGEEVQVSEMDKKYSFLENFEPAMDESAFLSFLCKDWPCFGQKLPRPLEPYIKRYFSDANGKIIDEDALLLSYPDQGGMFKHRVIYLPAEPGMGKTTFANSFSTKVEEEVSDTKQWVHLVTLQDLIGKLKEQDLTEEDVFGLDSCFKQRVFQKIRANVVLFLDGLDEIDYRSQLKVLEWVKSKQHEFEHVFLTGRLGTESTVERVLTRKLDSGSVTKDYSAWRFLPLNKEQLKDFFTKWWNKESKEELDQERLADYVEKAVERCEENSRLKNMIGIPLMAQMMAVVFQEHAESYCKGRPMKTITDKTDIDSLYKSFFDGKWEIFRRRHLSGLDAIILKILKSHYETLHQHLGFENIFAGRISLGCRSPNRECSLFSDEDNLDVVLRHGIIKQAVKEGDSVTYVFQHRTFAEYSAAMFIIKGVREATHSEAAREAYKLMFLEGQPSVQ